MILSSSLGLIDGYYPVAFLGTLLFLSLADTQRLSHSPLLCLQIKMIKFVKSNQERLVVRSLFTLVPL
jgi:hypothetical protein